MSYHGMGQAPQGPPNLTSTQLFAEAVDPYSWRNFPPGAVYAPYGWGPDFNIGMPMRYTHHIGYERTPVGKTAVKPNPAGARRIGTYYDVVGRPSYGYKLGDVTDRLSMHVLAEMVLWSPGYPRVPKKARSFQLVKVRGNKLWTRFFDAKGRELGVVRQKWDSARPVQPGTKTQMVYKWGNAWGPSVTPESEVGPVPVAFPREEDVSVGNYESDYRGVFSPASPQLAPRQRLG